MTPRIEIDPPARSPGAQLAGPVLIDRQGDVTARGVLRIKDGASSRTVVYRPATDPAPTASCSDANGDGSAGLTGLTIWYESRSGATAVADFLLQGEINQRGRYEADVEIRGVGRAPLIVGVSLIVR